MKLRIFGLFFGLVFLFLFTSVAKAQFVTNSCVAIAGDSVEHGMIVYNPGTGTFPAVETGTIASLVKGGVDYSVPAASLTKNNIYSDTQFVNSNCQTYVIGPWVNDLGQSNATSTISAIGQIVNHIKSKNPNAKILLVNYYTPHPTSWATNIWPNFSISGLVPTLVGTFNNLLSSQFSSTSGVKIINTTGFGPGDVTSTCEIPLCTGKETDGVHLSSAGKQKLANLINNEVGSAPTTTTSSTSTPITPATGITAGAGASTPGKLDLQCIGRGLSSYMNAVISGAGNLPHIRLLSPVFNITDTTNPASQILSAMQSAGANFDGISALAANTYVLNGVPGYKYYTDNFKSFADSLGKSVVFTEYGGEKAGIASDYKNVAADSKIIGALFFNALNTNSRFSSYAIDPGTMRSLTAPDPSKAGVNSATYVVGGGTFPDRVKAYDSSLGWDLEILNTPGDLQAAIDAAKKAHANGLKPIFRLCASGNVCAFANPQVLVDFLKNFSANQEINGDVWFVAGPNEPETELWATPSCGSGTSVLPVPYDVSKEIPCNQTVDKEFHSLRPYPASPCYKKVDETAMMCSNDLIVKKTFHVTPNGNCSAPDARGNFTCTYSYTGVQDTVSIDLTNAKLPVVGNTEDVPNATWTSVDTNANNLTAGQRVNNYVSWYLNGVIDRAEEDFSSFDTKYLVNYAGPIKKLLPWTSQVVDRLTSVSNATQTVNNQKDPNDNTARHNEVVGCPWIDRLYGLGTVLPCYVSSDFVSGLIDSASKSGSVADQIAALVLKATLQKITSRLTDWNAWLPPLETDSKYTSLQDYWRAYLTWRGNICTPNLLGTHFYLCAGLTNAFTVWAQLFPYTPLSSTEDRVGTVFTDKNNPSTGHLDQSIQLKDGEGNGGTVDNVSFTPESDSHNLYFSHMQENADLAKVLQSTVATKGDPKDPNNWEGQLQAAIKNQDEARPGNTYGCVKQEIISNPGDNLYGNIDRVKADGTTDKKITGTLKYDATFTCEFKPQTDPTCVANGGKNCTTTNECSKDIYTSLSVYTKTPKSFEIWQRLVGCDPSDPNQPNCNGSGGAMGIFKRFFPKPGQDSVLTNIKDIPGATTVSYNSDADTKAGKTGQDGSTANLYFAHVGSLEEYFLQGIQTALRPKGVGDQQLSGQPTTSTNLSGYFQTLQSIPSTFNSQAKFCGLTYVNSSDAQKYADDIKNILPSQKALWERWFSGYYPTQEMNLFGNCGGGNCLDFILNTVVNTPICNNNTRLNPYMAIAIALNETGGLRNALGTNANKHFGCNIASFTTYNSTSPNGLACSVMTANNKQVVNPLLDLTIGSNADGSLSCIPQTARSNRADIAFNNTVEDGLACMIQRFNLYCNSDNGNEGDVAALHSYGYTSLGNIYGTVIKLILRDNPNLFSQLGAKCGI